MIYIVRDGESVVNVENRLTCKDTAGDLTDLGRKQARLTGNWLAHKNITRLYTSPFDRAIQTASIVGELINLTPEIDDDLREIDCGELEGHTDGPAWDRWYATFRRWRAGDWAAQYPDGETFREGFERFSRILLEATNSENAALVTHGGITLSVVPYLCVNAAALQRVSGLSNTGMIVLQPYNMGRYICESWNLIEHLE